MSEQAVTRAAILRARAEAAAAALPPLLLARGSVTMTATPGGHGLRRPGVGEDFWQYRPAHAGDSARSIDWRRSARGDSEFIRDRERQTMRSAAIWVGRGAGMGYGGQRMGRGAKAEGETKSDRARLIALALGLSLIRAGERVGMLGEPPGSGAAQAENLSLALARPDLLREDDDQPDPAAIRPGQAVVLIDDFLSNDNALNEFLKLVSSGGGEGAMLQVLHPDEEEFPFSGAVRFESAGGRIHETRDAHGLRAAYLARLEARRTALAQAARQAGFVFGTHDLAHPVSDALIWLHGVLSAR
ncbi:MAG: DUF58 domain-containing protein [Paracoccus sp. (in: a-proteobacteria)]